MVVPNIGTFWSSGNLAGFWDYVFVLLKYIMPGVMIVVAIIMVGLLLKLTIAAFKNGTDPDGRRSSDDDDDIEIRRY